MPSVAVVICNFNKKDYVLACIESVFASSFTDLDVIVVDNASTDGAAEAIEERYGGRLTLLVNAENLGGSGGFHRGMAHAMQSGYTYIHLLDNDTLLHPDAIGALYRFMETHPAAGACGSLICKMNQKEVVQEYGAALSVETLGIRQLHQNDAVSGALPEYLQCDYVAACSAMYRVEALQKAGIMDKDFFIYWDDVALSLNIRECGWQIYATKASIVWHYQGFKEATNTAGIYYFFRNKLYVFAKYAGEDDFKPFCRAIVTRLFRTLLVNRTNPEVGTAYLHAFNDALNNVRGKAGAEKVLPIPAINTDFLQFFQNREDILLVCECHEFDIIRLVQKIQQATQGRVTIHSGGHVLSHIDGVRYTESDDFTGFDAVVRLCPHILDEASRNPRYAYIDKYMNQLLMAEDFEAVENCAPMQRFFEHTWAGFTEAKLSELREALRSKA